MHLLRKKRTTDALVQSFPQLHQHKSNWVPAQPLPPGRPDGAAELAPLRDPRKRAGVFLEYCSSPAVSIWHTSPAGPQPAGTAQNSLGAALDYTRE